MNHCAPSVRLSDQEYNDLEGILDEEPKKELYCYRYLEPQTCKGCGLAVRHASSLHRIVVFEDPLCPLIQALDHTAELVPYSSALGPCVSYEQYLAEGKPTHHQGGR